MEDIKKILSLFRKEVTDHNQGHKPYPIGDQVNRIAALFTPGKFYYYVLNFYDLTMEHVSPGVRNVLGIEPEKFTLEKYLEIVHPDNIPQLHKREAKIAEYIRKIDPQELPFYKFSYFVKLKLPDGKTKRILHQATTLSVSDANKIGHVLGVHIDVSHLKFVDDQTFSVVGLRNDIPSEYSIDPENDNTGTNENKNYKNLTDVLSNREIEVIKYIAKGLNTAEIAQSLNISEHTVRTHRKNILEKTNSNNTAEVVSKAVLEGVI